MDAIRRRVATRALTAGERLPSIRSFATTMNVSPSTVVEAFDRLAAEGLIRSRPGSGFYVAGAMSPLTLAEVEPRPDRAIDPFWISRQSLDAGTDMLKAGLRLASGRLDAQPRDPPRHPQPRQSRRRGPGGLRQHARLAGPAPLAGPAIRGRRDRSRRGPDPPHRVRHAIHRPDLSHAAAPRRHGAGGRSLLLQLPCTAAGASGTDRRRTLHADGTRPDGFRGYARRAPAAPLHHQFRAPQPDRGHDRAADGPSAAERGGGP